jgi:hypothetical protein
MNKRTLAALLIVAALATAAACGGDNANYSNVNRANANVRPTATATPTPTPRSINANMSREEYDRDKDSVAAEARRLGRTIGTGADDGWNWLKVRGKLAAADDLRDSTINVDVDNGTVTLSGSVANSAQKTRATALVKEVDPKLRVTNNLAISSGNTNSPAR